MCLYMVSVSIFGFVSLALIPIPFVFVRYGPELRGRSLYTLEVRELSKRLHNLQEQETNDIALDRSGECRFR